MKISQYGIDTIKRFEGLELEAYRDIAGVLTIGYGHTGADLKSGDVVTPDEAEALLRLDVTRFEDAVNGSVDVPLNQYQFDALVSFTYNVGVGAFQRSTALKRLNKGDYKGAANALLLFNKATINGVKRPVEGLTRRRESERLLFLTPPKELTNAPKVDGFIPESVTNVRAEEPHWFLTFINTLFKIVVLNA